MAKTTVTAIYENGIFKPLEKIRLPNHEKLQLMILPAKEKISELVKSQKETFKKYCGIGKSGLTNIGRNHNKYLYGN